MKFYEWINVLFFKQLASLVDYILKQFQSVDAHQKALNSLLLPRQQCQRLYQQLTQGKSSEKLIARFQQEATNPNLSSAERGQANLLLSLLYKENIQIGDFVSRQNINLARFHEAEAVKLLGPKSHVTSKIKFYMGCIRSGGEPQYAYKKLQEYANKDEDNPLMGWSNKILSFVYNKGVYHENLRIAPDKALAKQHKEKAKEPLKKFYSEIKGIMTKVTQKWFSGKSTFVFLKKVARVGDQETQFKYANYLESRQGVSKETLSFYTTAARKTKATALTPKTKGNIKAQRRLVSYLDTAINEVEASNQSSHYQFQLALNKDNEQRGEFIERIAAKAKESDRISKLQLALYYLSETHSIKKAEKLFQEVIRGNSEKVTHYEVYLLKKLCFELGSYFEQLALSQTSAFEAKVNDDTRTLFQKAIFYFKQLPNTYKEYEEIQVNIAHYQKYYLNDLKQAAATFQRLSHSGNLGDAHASILCAFEHFWSMHQAQLSLDEQKTIAEYEQKHRSFFQEVKALTSVVEQTNDNQSVFNLFIAQLEAHKQTTNNQDKGLNAIIQDLQKLVATLAKKPQEILNIRATHFFTRVWMAGELKMEKTMVLGFLNLLAFVDNKLKDSESAHYFEIIKKQFFDYLIIASRELFLFDKTDVSSDEMRLNTTKAEVMVYAR